MKKASSKLLLVISVLALSVTPMKATAELPVVLSAHQEQGTAAAQAGAGISQREQIVIYVDGQSLSSKNSAFIERGATFVPLREFATSVGATVSWDGVHGVVTIRDGATLISHQVGTQQMSVNGNTIHLTVPSQIVAHTTYLPFRDLANALDASFRLWKTAERTIISVQTQESKSAILEGELASVDAYLQQVNFMGQVLIAQQGEVLFQQGYGPAGDGKLNDPQRQTRIASISKQFTAAAILQLVEAGKLKLTDNIAMFLPDFPRGAEITVEMLLNHTSGLPADIPRILGAGLNETVAAVHNMKLVFEPGTAYRYSNPGYVLLAYIIQDVSGQSFGTYLQEHIFQPLGMKNTGEATPHTDTIKGHLVDERGLLKEADYYVSQSGTGSLYSTVMDLWKWDQALYTEKILSQSSIERMFTEGPHKNYGFGWEIEEGQGTKIVSTTGGGKGYTTKISRDLENRAVIILLSNQEKVEINKIMDDLRRIISAE